MIIIAPQILSILSTKDSTQNEDSSAQLTGKGCQTGAALVVCLALSSSSQFDGI